MPDCIGRAARDFFQLSIYDAQNDHVVTLQLKRHSGMTPGDLAQLQNFLWCQIGQAIRDDADLRRRLEIGGVRVLLNAPERGN